MNELLMLSLNIQRRKVHFANNSLFFLISEVTIEEEDVGNGSPSMRQLVAFPSLKPLLHLANRSPQFFFRQPLLTDWKA
jgi:hypothetical protein